jgi:hypothetical protein
LLADLFDGGLRRQRQFRNAKPKVAEPAGLRQDGVGFPVQLLQQKVEPLADFAARLQDLVQLAGMNLQARNLLADIAAVGQQGRFLRQALRIDHGVAEQLLELFDQAFVEGGNRRGANPLHFFTASHDGGILLADEGGQLRAFARSKLVERVNSFLKRRQDGFLGGGVGSQRIGGSAEDPRKQQDSIQIRLRVDAFLRRRFAKRRQVRAKERQIETARCAIGRTHDGTAHVDVPAEDGSFQRGAHNMLERIQLGA